MKLTTDHPQSSYGIPVFVDGGDVIEYADGVRRLIDLMQQPGESRKDARNRLAAKTDFSVRTIEGWEQGRLPDPRALFAMQEILKAF